MVTLKSQTGLWRRLSRILRTRSLLGLLMFGFLLVVTPLVGGLLAAGQQIGQVTRQSEALIERTFSSAQSARELGNRLVAVERAARQFRVLRDEEAESAYGQQREAFKSRIDSLVQMERDQASGHQLAEMVGLEQELASWVLLGDEQPEWPPALARGFRELDGQVREFMAGIDADATRALAEIQQLGAQARASFLFYLAMAIAFAVLLAVLFTSLINRPILQLDRGIRALVRPDSEPIPQVDHPRDLRALSVRLEWVRRKLERAERDRLKFLGQVSHELKTPLSAIREGVVLLNGQFFGELGDRQREVLSIMSTSVHRLQDQIDDLLRYNRIRSGLATPRRTSIDVGTLIDEVLRAHQLGILAHETVVRVEIEQELSVLGDPDMLQTAIDNLVSNAIKFSSPGQTVAIIVERMNSRVSIDVCDRGHGIRAGERSRVFDPFFRGQSQEQGNIPGSGLGLAICRELVRAHGGDIEMVERQGWTTVFRLYLPVEPVKTSGRSNDQA